MTDRFIDNFTPGSGGDGLSWANAELTAAAVDAADAAGDRWLFDYRHSETTASALTYNVAGTLASPSQLLSVTQTGAAGVSSLTRGAIIANTGGGNFTMQGNFYAYGLILRSAGSLLLANTAPNVQAYENCTFDLSGTAGQIYAVNSGTTGRVTWKDCTIKFANAAHYIISRTYLEWRGGGVESGTTTPSYLYRFLDASSRGGMLFDGVDLSNFASTLNLVSLEGGSGVVTFRNCKLPASWSGSLVTGSKTAGKVRAELRNCDAGDVNYGLWVEDYAGSAKHETTLVKTGGASDGTTGISWKVATSADAKYPVHIFVCPEIAKWNETTGSAVTVTVDFLHDSATNLQNDDIWLEVEYLGTSGFPLAVFADNAVADVIATPADQAASTATWTTTGMTNPNEQKLSVTFTPQEKGLIIARVCMGIASKTVYVDPELQVS